MVSIPLTMVVVCILIATFLKKSAQNDAEARRANQRIDGMTADDMRAAAFGQQQATTKKQSVKPATSLFNTQSKPANKPVKNNTAKSKPRKNTSDTYANYKKSTESSAKKLEEDILTRSVHNAGEDFNDDTIRESADKHEYCSAPHFEETEDFNKTVRDLIVFGPNCNMSYERDFIAEGEKMLNLGKI
ncbi:MAG: hypothetical protein IKX99_08090 [Lachnospiraceae bacterium]|nr:hypothetical protein [Lachnospiraceae bacterium]